MVVFVVTDRSSRMRFIFQAVSSISEFSSPLLHHAVRRATSHDVATVYLLSSFRDKLLRLRMTAWRLMFSIFQDSAELHF